MKKKAPGLGGTTVEPKRVFIQVVVEMFIPNGPLVGANEPSFQQRSNTVRARQNDTCSRISTARLNTSLMLVSVRRQAVVTGPSVGRNYRADFHNVLYEVDQTGSCDIGDLPETYPAKPLGRVYLNGYSNNGFGLCFSATHSLFLSADVRFINLNMSAELVPVRTYHGTAQLVQPSPSSLITTQPEDSLQT
jgi:hypothetical protein